MVATKESTRIALKGSSPLNEIVHCEFCGAERMYETIAIGDIDMQCPFPSPCTCENGIALAEREKAEREAQLQAEHEQEERNKLQGRVDDAIKNSGMGARSLQHTFDTYDSTHSPDAKRLHNGALAFVESFKHILPKRMLPVPKRSGMLIIGNMGTGKTHITAAIANSLLNKGISVICMTERGLLGLIRQTFSERNRSEKDVLDRYINTPLLIIDDLGKEKATDWSLATLYAIIDGRYESALPIIVTTNYDPDNLINRITPPGGDATTAECIVDRLKEMCHIAIIEGESWRAK